MLLMAQEIIKGFQRNLRSTGEEAKAEKVKILMRCWGFKQSKQKATRFAWKRENGHGRKTKGEQKSLNREKIASLCLITETCIALAGQLAGDLTQNHLCINFFQKI